VGSSIPHVTVSVLNHVHSSTKLSATICRDVVKVISVAIHLVAAWCPPAGAVLDPRRALVKTTGKKQSHAHHSSVGTKRVTEAVTLRVV